MIKLQKVTIGYDDKKVLKDINLTIKKGEFIGIFGSNNSGKSTLLQSFVGNIKIFSGDFLVFENKLNSINKNKLNNSIRKNISFLSQEGNLIEELTVSENILIGLANKTSFLQLLLKIYTPEHFRKLRKIIDVFDLEDIAFAKVKTLSSGQKQIVALAKTIISERSVIILDEPLSTVNQKSAKKILDLLRKINIDIGVTVIISFTNTIMARKYCQRIIGLYENKIIFDGEISQLEDSTLELMYGNITHKAIKEDYYFGLV